MIEKYQRFIATAKAIKPSLVALAGEHPKKHLVQKAFPKNHSIMKHINKVMVSDCPS